MFSKKRQSAVEGALENVQVVLSERQKITDALAATRAAEPLAEASLQDALEALGTAECEAALTAGSSTSGARQALNAARESVDGIRARIQGLTRRLEQHDESVLEAAAELERARGAWSERLLAEYGEKYKRAAEAFAAVVHEGLALAEALGRQLRGLDAISLPVPDDTDVAAVDMHPHEFHAGLSRMVAIKPWSGNQAAIQVFEAHRGPAEKAAEIDQLVQDIRKRRSAAEQLAAHAPDRSERRRTSGGEYDFHDPDRQRDAALIAARRAAVSMAPSTKVN